MLHSGVYTAIVEFLFQDVIIVASAVMLNAGNDDSGSWADSESDFELSNFDVEMGPAAAEVWRCAECREPNTPRMRYCSRCWKVRTIPLLFVLVEREQIVVNSLCWDALLCTIFKADQRNFPRSSVHYIIEIAEKKI
jgi:hypothetical protein